MGLPDGVLKAHSQAEEPGRGEGANRTHRANTSSRGHDNQTGDARLVARCFQSVKMTDIR
jgi:hypothetical protein